MAENEREEAAGGWADRCGSAESFVRLPIEICTVVRREVGWSCGSAWRVCTLVRRDEVVAMVDVDAARCEPHFDLFPNQIEGNTIGVGFEFDVIVGVDAEKAVHRIRPPSGGEWT